MTSKLVEKLKNINLVLMTKWFLTLIYFLPKSESTVRFSTDRNEELQVLVAF